jgi:outer membrane protein assembly factor BamB
MRRAALCFVLLLAPALASAESLFERGFVWSPKGADAALPVVNAVTVKSMVVVQLGADYVVGLNTDSGNERWRFASKTHAIRAMSLHGDTVIVQAEQLEALSPMTGDAKWQFPLNCYPGKCNTTVRQITDEFTVLTGFDGAEDNVLLLDTRTGARVWPNWVQIPKVQTVLITPAAIVVASGVAPYPVVALDRFTSRERWKLLPAGVEGPATGIETDGTTLNAWWKSGSADVVLAVDLTTGKTLTDWTVARRKGVTGELRGVAPGVFIAYQPSRLSGGTLRAYDNRTGNPLWKKDLPDVVGSPVLIGDRLLVRETSLDNGPAGITASAFSAATGDQLWRYVRPDASSIEWRFEGGRAIAVLEGRTAFVGIIDLVAGAIEGVAPVEGKTPNRIRYFAGSLYLFRGPEVERLDAVEGDALVTRFTELLKLGDVDKADALAKKTKPFVQELAAAAKINKVVGGQSFQSTSQKMRAGGLPALLAALQTASTDDKVTFYDDFRAFILTTRDQVKKLGPGRVDGDDLQRLSAVTQRLADLGVRFERQLAGAAGEDKAAIQALSDVTSTLAEALIASDRVDDAYAALARLWARGWAPHKGAFAAAMKIAVAYKVRELLPGFESAVAAKDGADIALANIADLAGLDALLEAPPSVDAIPDMTPSDFASTLDRLKAATGARTPK